MARCGCEQAGGTCNCAVVAGANITVSGTGNAGSPYVVSTAAAATPRGYVEAEDSPTIDTTVSATGTLADPYQVRGDVNIDPDGGNLLQATGDGLLVPCSSVLACVAAESPGELPELPVSAECLIEGDGTVSDPLNLAPIVDFDSTENTYVGPFNFPGGSTPTLTRNIVNPSDCASAMVVGWGRTIARCVIVGATYFELSMEFGWAGNTTSGTFAADKSGTGGQNAIVNGVTRPRMIVIPPGGNETFNLRCFASAGNAADDFDNVRLQIDLLMILNPIP